MGRCVRQVLGDDVDLLQSFMESGHIFLAINVFTIQKALLNFGVQSFLGDQVDLTWLSVPTLYWTFHRSETSSHSEAL